MDLEELLQSAPVWRGRSSRRCIGTSASLTTGWTELDKVLPGGGWPLGSLIEIMLERHGLGELQLLMPALADLTRRRGELPQQWVVWIAPPFIPYAPALASYGLDLSRVLWVHPPQGTGSDADDVLWSMEQALRSGSSAAVLAWVKRVDGSALRRLQLAAEQGGSLAVLFRPGAAAKESSPAALRLMLRGGGEGTDVEVLKCRGGYPARLVNVLASTVKRRKC